MTDLRKAAEMALETFEKIYEGCGQVRKDNLSKHSNDLATLVRKDCIPQIEALRHALHSTKFLPEEMDAYERGFIEGRQDQMRSTVERAVNAMADCEFWEPVDNVDMSEERVHKTYKSIHEPVAYRCWNNHKNADGTFDTLRIWTSLKPEGYGNEPLYTAPPKQWVGLTDKEVRFFRKKCSSHDVFAQAIEAKLKEKNGG